ncbi:MAG TPA: thermonuclease family protein [Candidatus Obscuribacterales bacterium]
MKVQFHNIKLACVITTLAVALACWLVPASAEQFQGRVVGVSDGDTLTVLCNGVPRRVRLEGIDCPEKRQAFGARARQFSAERAFGRTVTVVTSAIDRYGRDVGVVILPGGRILNRDLVAGGFAWQYRKYSSDPILLGLEEQARAGGTGLWSQPNPLPPWDFRAQSRRVNQLYSRRPLAAAQLRAPAARYRMRYSKFRPYGTSRLNVARYP